MRARCLTRDDHGVSSVAAFLVAGVLFVGVMGAVLMAGNGLGDRQTGSAEAAGHQLAANNIADLLLEKPGHMADGLVTVPWDGASDDIERLGLLNDTTGNLDFRKFKNLASAALAANATDGFVNYPEARSSLGLDEEDLDFHIRAAPKLDDVTRILETGVRDPNLRVAYVGHQVADDTSGGDPGDGLVIDAPACTTDGDDEWHLETVLTNNGQAETQFSVKFHAVLDGVAVDQSSNTFRVPVGGSTDVALEVPYADGAACTAGSTIEVEVWDPSRLLNTSSTTLASGVSAPPNPSDKLLYANPSKPHFATDEDVVIAYDGNLTKDDPLSLTIYEGDGSGGLGPVVYTDSMTVPSSQNKWKFDPVPEATFDGLGTTEFWAYINDGSSLVGDRFLVEASAPGDFVPSSGALTYEWDDSVPIEAGFLADLVEMFCPFEYDSKAANVTSEDDWDARCEGFKEPPVPALQPGDIFPDDKQVANTELRDRLWDDDADSGAGAPRYDETNTLVVGSNVAHNSMTSNAIKDAIGEWVLGGGTLIVFGHDDKNVQWLQSIFHAGIESSSGGIAVPDSNHPILRVADLLSPNDYDNDGKAWKFSSNTEELFTHIVVEGDEPVLTISNPGALGDGTVILTTWLPYDLFGDGSVPDDALALVNNFLMQGYRDVFLDYGPTLPDSSVIPSSRLMPIDHPELGTIVLDVQVWVFRAS